MTSLLDGHDGLFLDLDGVVYAGSTAVPHAAASIATARERGVRVAFLTNNASRTPEAVAAHLSALGVPAAPEDVVTSAQAAAALLAADLDQGARVFTLGGDGLWQALRDAGLEPCEDITAVAVATGYGPDVQWSSVMRAALVIAHGAPWVASNTDRALPTDDGPAPGHGMLAGLLADFSGHSPRVAGKPGAALLEEAVRRTDARRPLVVGDRLDTDIRGAALAGIVSALVLTGVTTRQEAAAAVGHDRPTHVLDDLRGLWGHPARCDGHA